MKELIVGYLPYKLKVRYQRNTYKVQGINIEYGSLLLYGDFGSIHRMKEMCSVDIERCRPILRLMSDLCKPCLECNKVPAELIAEILEDTYFNEEYSMQQFIYELVNGIVKTGIFKAQMIFDFLNKHHFDYRYLIDKGFAIDINKIKQEYGH